MIRKTADFFIHIRTMLRRHMSVGLIGSGVLAFALAFLIFQGFLRNEYLQYLLDETGRTEAAVLDMSAVNINNTIKSELIAGAQVAMDAELYRFMKDIAEEETPSMRNILRVNTRLSNLTYYDQNIAALAVVNEQGIQCEYGRYWHGSGYGNLWEGEEKQSIAEKLYTDVMSQNLPYRGQYLISTEPARHEGFPSMLLYHVAYPLIGDGGSMEKAPAVVILSMRLDSVIASSALSDDSQGKYITEYLTDTDGKILYHQNSELTGLSKEDLGENATEVSLELNYFGWSVNARIDTVMVQNTVRHMFNRGSWAYVLLLLAAVVVWQIVLWRTMQPVQDIGRAMEKIRSGDLKTRIEVKGENELWQLAGRYNRTADALEEQRRETERAYEEKMLTVQRCNAAELEALESQIDAHYLSNTLGAITYTTIEHGDTEVSELLKRLSNSLSYTFSRKRREVTLGDEIQWVEEYLYLQKYRLMDVFDYEIDFPEEYSEWPCCKLFLQPFVENSIVHGFDGWEKGGKIRISGREEDGRFRLDIMDNGQGMSEQVQRIIREVLNSEARLNPEEIGIGIQNCLARMRMYYGSELQVKLETAPDEGCRFTFWLPIPESSWEMLEEENDEK